MKNVIKSGVLLLGKKYFISKKLDLASTRGPEKLKINNKHINFLALNHYFGCKNTKNL